jgi:hypothetical protein
VKKTLVVGKIVVLRYDFGEYEYVGLGFSVCMFGSSLLDFHSVRQAADCVISIFAVTMEPNQGNKALNPIFDGYLGLGREMCVKVR